MNDPLDSHLRPEEEREIFVGAADEGQATRRRLSAIAIDLKARTPKKSVFAEEIGCIIRASTGHGSD